MMDKKILIAISLSVATVWFMNYYFTPKVGQQQQLQGGVVAVNQQPSDVVPGQPVRVPSQEDIYKPLQLDVEFSDQKLASQEVSVSVETDYCKAILSSYGAVLTNLDFKEHPGKAGTPLRTVYNKGSFELEDRKKGCFLLALDKKTPYQYTFLGKNEIGQTIDVAFKTETDQWVIQKTYSFQKNSNQIDVVLMFEPKSTTAGELKPRLFLAAPFVGEIEDDVISLVIWNEKKETLETKPTNEVQDFAWFWQTNKPIFGAEDRYFVHTLVSDEAKFVQRGYVKQFDTKSVYSVFEGPVLMSNKKNEYRLSFYMGPKLFDHLNAVDSRLEEVLSFGWLSWFCKWLLKLLSWIYDFVGNFGIAIILMTVVLKLPFTPLSIYARKQMEVYQHYLPSINKIRTKYRQDLTLQHQELMKFYKDHNISPTTQFVGCLPLLIQMPILFSLYRVLNNYLALYQAPFIGWIVDLSAKDPYYVLPVLMGLSMMWQQSMQPVTDEKQRFMMFFMAIVMTVVFASFPAGLVLYWLMNNLLTIGEDYLRKLFFR
jgi:YidC/Oxa1 family membrane protein insertase